MAVIIPAIIGAGIGIYSIAHNASKEKKARQAMENNKRPTYKIPQSEYDTLNLLGNRAGQGLSSSARSYYNQMQDRGLSSSLDAILKGGGDLNNAGGLVQRYFDSGNKLAVLDDQAKMQNINALIQQRQRMAAFQDKSFYINQYAPYADKQAAAAQELGMAQQGQQAGINTLGSSLSNLGSGISNRMATNNIGKSSGGFGSTPSNNISLVGKTNQPFGMNAPQQQGMVNGTGFNNFSLGAGYQSQGQPFGMMSQPTVNASNYNFNTLKPDDRAQLYQLLGY